MEPRHAVRLAHAQDFPLKPDGVPLLSHDAALHAAIGDPAGERVVIIGHDTLDLMCAVIREGAAEVTLLRLRERPEAEEADLAILVGLGSALEASGAIMQARRALAPTGRIVIAATSAQLAGEVAASLRAQGFAGVRETAEAGPGVLVTAELPFFAKLGGAAHG